MGKVHIAKNSIRKVCAGEVGMVKVRTIKIYTPKREIP